jgi:hypothetical protein
MADPAGWTLPINEWQLSGNSSAGRRRQPLRDCDMCFMLDNGGVTPFELGAQILLPVGPSPLDCLFSDIVFDADFDSPSGAFCHILSKQVSIYSARFCPVHLIRKTMSISKSSPRYRN